MNIWGMFSFLDKGGWVAWALAGLCLFLWYGIGYRYLFLRSEYLRTRPEELLEKSEIQSSDLLGQMAQRLKSRVQDSSKDIETAIEAELTHFSQKILCQKQMIKSIVMVAPLLGLLGTVIGMIETFESLQDSALFSQSGGIAGGISQALITTQMGLVVAVPGLLIGRKLEDREQELRSFSEQMVSSLYLKGVKS